MILSVVVATSQSDRSTPELRTSQLPATHAREGTGFRARAGDHITIGASTLMLAA